MTPRQCEIAAESYTACLLAQCGYDISVQYGANQPYYDLIADKDGKMMRVSAKGSQDGGWMLAVKYKNSSNSYADAIDCWFKTQPEDVVFIFVQFIHVSFGDAPRVFIASTSEIAEHMKTQCNGRGHGSLQEDYQRDHPKSQYSHKIPSEWKLTSERLDRFCEQINKSS